MVQPNILTDYGLPEIAEEALQLVAAAAPQQHVRNIAVLNLFSLAVNGQDSIRFDSLRTRLRDSRLVPKQQTQFALLDAQGSRRLGRFGSAREALALARRLANRNQFFQLSFEVEAEAKRLADAVETGTGATSGRTLTRATTEGRPMAPDIRQAVDDIHSLTDSIFSGQVSFVTEA